MPRLHMRRPRWFRLTYVLLIVIMLNLAGWEIFQELSKEDVDDDKNNVINLNFFDQEDNLTSVTYSTTTNPAKPKIKTILFWTTFYEKPDFYFGFDQEPFISNQCPVFNCETTRDKKRLAEADAVVFHGPRIEEREPLPTYRPPGQIYILFQTEPQYYPSVAYLPQYGDMFNYTMASKREADAFIAYGWVIPSTYGKKVRKGVVVNPKHKPKSVVWMVSHCDTHGRREWYAQELAKHINVDVYGACGTLSCPIGDPCLDKFEMEYKFYLALENSYCKEYVTEKMYRTMTYDIIPIVFGGANYTLDAPPHSVINILDYPNPKDLATYLKYLSNNITAYDEYFEWKRHYIIQHFRHKIFGKSFCKLCEDLNNPDFEYKSYTNIANWWITGLCDSEVIPRMRQKFSW